MTSMSDQEFAEAEVLLRRRLVQLADHAPTAVRMPDEVAVVASHRPTGRSRRAGVIAAVAALIGAGGFTTYSFLGASSDSGAATPQEAVTTFVSAMQQEDVLGMIDVTLPEEVAALRSAVDSITSDATRVGLLADDFAATGVQGIDISVDDLVLDTNFLEGGLAAVTASSGTFSASIDPQAFPLGTQLRLVIGDVGPVSTAEGNLANSDPPAVIMTVERDGRWYVSVEYTIAEYARRAAGWEVPGPVTRSPVGFDSPEAAATSFYERLASLDLQSTIDTFAPGEDAVAWLAQTWMSDAQAAMERVRADGLALQISGLTYETIGEGDQLTLRPATFTVQGTTPSGFNQDSTDAADVADELPQPFTIERADGCTTLTGTLAESMFGSESRLSVATPVDGGYQVCGAGSNAVLGGLGLLIAGSGVDLPPVSVTQSGGHWYVSPLGTALASLTISLHDLAEDSSLLDSPLAPYLFDGLSRGTLEMMAADQSADSIDPACLPALTD